MTPYTSCKAAALGTKTNCINTCANEYTNGSSQYNSCVATCTAAYSTAVSACTQQYNYCLETGQQECDDVTCPGYCQDESSVTYCQYMDGCPTPRCSITCSCPMPPPACPTPLCEGTEWICYSPIIIDWKGEGFHLTSPQDGVYFDFTGKGHTRKLLGPIQHMATHGSRSTATAMGASIMGQNCLAISRLSHHQILQTGS